MFNRRIITAPFSAGIAASRAGTAAHPATLPTALLFPKQPSAGKAADKKIYLFC